MLNWTTMTDLSTSSLKHEYIECRGTRVHYVEAGSGRVVVLMHGSGPGATGPGNFSENIGPLSAGFRVIAVDMPGWGDSDTPASSDARDPVAILLEFLDRLGVGRAALVGNSMGAMTSIALAVLHPERVSHLVTMGAPSPVPSLFSPGGGPTEGMRILRETYADPSPTNFKRLIQTMVYDQSFATDELARTRAEAALARPDHLADYLANWQTGAGPFFSLGDQLKTITVPTLAIHGRDDRVINFENTLGLVARIPDSRALILNRCGHWAQLEHAAEFNRTVLGFLA
jgi:2-hydroxy-6-oxonona-2,4-dienedioate hydrolase